MRRIVPVTTTLIVAALLSPVGASTWSAFGSFEPDNALDTPSFMWADAPAPGQDRIYFAAFSTTGGLANVNVAALATEMEQVTLEFHEAILGVWTDCNGDGYVGMAETALYEYASELLLDDSVCPAVTGTPNSWTDGANNYNGWVSEFIPIGGVDPDPDGVQTDARVYRDAEAMVWGDYGRPTDGASAGGTCALTPLPRGTLASTGGFINYIGCPYPGVSGRWDEVILGRSVLGVFDYPGIDPSNSNDLAFNGDARESALEASTLGSEDDANSPATVWDCNSAPLLEEPTTGVIVYNVAPAPGNTGSPTVPGLVNHTVEGTWLLDDGQASSDCDTSNDRGADTYGTLEGDFNGVSTARKTESDWNFQFDDSARGSPFGLVLGGNGNGGTSNLFGIWPAQNGVGFVLTDQGPSMWYSDSQFVKRGPNTADVNTYTGAVDIDPAYFLTFYAHVGAASSGKGALPGGIGFYGTPQCGGNDSGIHNGWDCDASTWYVNPDGTLIPETYPFARPGQQYELRDVDCYDGQNSAGLAAGVPAYGNTPCP